MRLPHDTLEGTVICGVLLTAVLYALLRVMV
ncbi:MAG: hypothetical protein HONDAALG_00561 [Gammaproteobacteria bacterium]|nr:hypothetical protein [Gammaproteobacteria bacterium]